MKETALITEARLVRCPWCGNQDIVSPAFAKKGSISVCGRCFEPSVFVHKARLKRLSCKEYQAMPMSTRFKLHGIISSLRRAYEEHIQRN